ncbi:MAG TPA: adenylate/guanylate cyclase domain-containing protein [Gaiellaceae bacterium]|nr:adenylate/guanylate cyclase domain-containing protein [Gaiellaceae bacterium]
MHRKIVTVVFCDVVGSTALGESSDPEALQALLARYFERMKGIVESHGGSVEKFIGDAVMAVFGVPVVHEDDALRAVRAAAEMRDAFPALGVRGRIGVNTGEVVVGTVERLATGDAVNVAARLQQAADPDEILVGEATHDLVRGAVDAAPVEPLQLKGKAEPVAAYRLEAVHEAPERAHDAPFVGRAREVASIREAWQRAASEQRCELVTVVGDAGVGKSRIVAEALDQLDARVVRGRCLPYGDGVTYWPVVEVVKQLGARPTEPEAADAMRSLLGESTRVPGPEEIAWAFRKLLEQEAPLVVVFDDIQWGDDTFLDLVEAVGLLSTGAPILLVCMARPELLTRRSEWPVAIRVEPLAAEAVDEILVGLPPETRSRVASAAGGNPLFLTEMLAMAKGDGPVEVPPTLRALLGARLDQLDPLERAVLERGAVEGEVFHRGAVQALASPEVQVTPKLAALVRRQLIRPDRAQLVGDDGFRFRHLLIRDAAYDALPKATRAELHERFADWLDVHGADLVELDEIVGYHLEQAAKAKTELGQPDERLSLRAAERLAKAARRMLRPGNDRPARGLFARAVELTRPFTLDLYLKLDYAETLHWEDPSGASGVAAAAADRARSRGDVLGEAVAQVAEQHYRVFAEPHLEVDALEELALQALPLVEDADDHAGLAVVWRALGYGVANGREQNEQWAQAAERCIAHARVVGWPKGDAFGLAAALVWGPRPADEALGTLDELADELADAAYDLKRAYLTAALGRFEEAWALAGPATERLREFADARSVEWPFHLAVLEGDYPRAVQYGREVIDLVAERGLVTFQAAYGFLLGRCLCRLGRSEEAEPYAAFVRDVKPDDWTWMALLARIQAHRGEHESAERLARESVVRIEQTDALTAQGDTWWDLAEVLLAAGKTAEAIDALEQALERYERKKNLAMAAQIRPRLEDLRAAVASA